MEYQVSLMPYPSRIINTVGFFFISFFFLSFHEMNRFF